MGDPNQIVAQYGPWGLLVVSFIAATIIPLSSEIAVYSALRLGMPGLEVLLFASIGNCLGVLFNYGLGRWGSDTVMRKSMESKAGRRAMAWTERYGKWSLLLSWLPVVGDPLTLVAGVMRVHLLFFIVTAFGVRVLRYAAIVMVV
jgi:membrane protein YqaA with SNARE-associated domain